jgi:GntR family transcriptional regulator
MLSDDHTSDKEMSTLDRRSIVLQVRDELRQTIEDQGLSAGDRIPSESEIAARFGVSRGTVREAMKLLEQSGLIGVQQGRGRFASAIARLMVDRPVTEFESVTEMLEGLGYHLTNRVLSTETAAANEDEATALEIPVGTQVMRLRRLRLHAQEALIYEIDILSAELLEGRSPNEVDFSGSLNAWLESVGRRLVSSVATMQAVELPAEIKALPEVDGDQPWLLISERCVDREGFPTLFSQDFHRGDIFSFHVLRQCAT